MFIVTITSYKGKVYLGKNLKPCKDKNNSRLFKTRQAAASYIVKNWKQWDGVKNGCACMNIELL